jgi:hypothetical protein
MAPSDPQNFKRIAVEKAEPRSDVSRRKDQRSNECTVIVLSPDAQIGPRGFHDPALSSRATNASIRGATPASINGSRTSFRAR